MARPDDRLGSLYVAASCLLAALCLLVYQIGPDPAALVAALVFVRVAFGTPTAGLVAVILFLPYHLVVRPVIGNWSFSAAELGTLLTCLAAAPKILARALAEARGGLAVRPREAWNGTGWIAFGAIAFVALGFLSLAASVRLDESLRALRTIVLEPVALLFVALYAPDGRARQVGRSRAAWLAGAVVLSAAATSALGLYQIPTDQRLVRAEDGLIRIRALYGSPNHLALFLGRALPIALGVLAFYRGHWRWAAGLAALLITAAVFFSYSIGAWAALPVALFVVAALRGRRILVGYVAVGLALALAAIPFLLRMERFSSHLDLTGGTNLFRLAVWTSSLAMIRDHPVFGIGLDNFLYYYRDLGYMLPSAWAEPNLSHAHNLFLDFWLSLGFLGLVLALLLLVGFFAKALAGYREGRGRPDWTAPIALGLIGGMADFVLHGLVDNSYFLPDLAVLFWLGFAILGLAWVESDSHPIDTLSTDVPNSEAPRIDASSARALEKTS